LIVAHYIHRLPADYDVAAIRRRARERGSIWDAASDLYFKAFLLRETNQFGATASSFSSLYLWQRGEAFRDWLVRGGYRIVTESFGRAEIETFFALGAFNGTAHQPRFLYRRDVGIAPDEELTTALAREIEQARERSMQPDAVSSVISLDPHSWKFIRVVLSEQEPAGSEDGVAYQIAHLSRPLLGSLPQGARS